MSNPYRIYILDMVDFQRFKENGASFEDVWSHSFVVVPSYTTTSAFKERCRKYWERL